MSELCFVHMLQPWPIGILIASAALNSNTVTNTLGISFCHMPISRHTLADPIDNTD